MTLAVEGRGEVTLDRRSPPFSFPADVPVTAVLPGGPIEDFNVMTRRGRYRHFLMRAQLDAATVLTASADLTIVVVVAGSVVAGRGGVAEDLGGRDTLIFERGAPVRLAPRPSAELVIVDLWRCESGEREESASP
jgi:environmental stress-induced protein Ves